MGPRPRASRATIGVVSKTKCQCFLRQLQNAPDSPKISAFASHRTRRCARGAGPLFFIAASTCATPSGFGAVSAYRR